MQEIKLKTCTLRLPDDFDANRFAIETWNLLQESQLDRKVISEKPGNPTKINRKLNNLGIDKLQKVL